MAASDSDFNGLGIGRPGTMKRQGKVLHCLVGFFRRFKAASNVMALPVKFDSSDVATAPLVERHPLIPGRVIALFSAIAVVFGRRGFSEVCPAVVRFNLVDVVDFFRRPNARHPHPNNAVSEILLPFNAYFNTPLVVQKSSAGAFAYPARKGHVPSNLAGMRGVVKGLSDKPRIEV